MLDIAQGFLLNMMTESLGILVVLWFSAYYYLHFVMTDRNTPSGADLINTIIARKYK